MKYMKSMKTMEGFLIYLQAIHEFHSKKFLWGGSDHFVEVHEMVAVCSGKGANSGRITMKRMKNMEYFSLLLQVLHDLHGKNVFDLSGKAGDSP
ncbi:MAG: hypothetical protein RB296_00990 [Acidobacteriota bacterium]|jgi:hypothetical protein|nr:hypothetical protein [Acidobacteriota bacterium]